MKTSPHTAEPIQPAILAAIQREAQSRKIRYGSSENLSEFTHQLGVEIARLDAEDGPQTDDAYLADGVVRVAAMAIRYLTDSTLGAWVAPLVGNAGDLAVQSEGATV